MQLFGTSGIRRLAERDLIELALISGMAVGTIYKNIIIGRDTRTSGSVLRHAITAGILAVGARCSDSGILPTPTLALITREFDAGIMLTASHNPPQYNGIKMLNPDGSAFSSDQQKQIEDLIYGLKPFNIRWDNMESEEIYSTAVEKHIDRIHQDFSGGIKAKVVVDCDCGAAFFTTPYLLSRLGCEVTTLNCYPSGFFPHDIEPIKANLDELMQAVKYTGSDLGIAHDGDADRMMAIDDSGRFISGDKLLAIFARASESKNIVTTIDASMIVEQLGLTVKRTKVGDPYVSAELKRWGDFGGEPSGAWVFPQISLCPDGIYAAAKITAIASEHKLSELVDDLPEYPVIRGNIEGSFPDIDSIKEVLISKFKPLTIETTDGIRLTLKDGWVLIRPSGTEPKIRLTAEAKDELTVHHYYDRCAKIVLDYLHKE
jgi:phosphoglucosamine mutase